MIQKLVPMTPRNTEPIAPKIARRTRSDVAGCVANFIEPFIIASFVEKGGFHFGSHLLLCGDENKGGCSGLSDATGGQGDTGAAIIFPCRSRQAVEHDWRGRRDIDGDNRWHFHRLELGTTPCAKNQNLH